MIYRFTVACPIKQYQTCSQIHKFAQEFVQTNWCSRTKSKIRSRNLAMKLIRTFKKCK